MSAFILYTKVIMDYTSFSVFMQKNKGWLAPAVLVLLAFIAGWHTGRAMSPYYGTNPIVFEDRECSDCSSSGGSAEELVELREAGEADKKSVASKSTPKPAVAAAQAEASKKESGKFVGSVNSDLYHHPSCSHAQRIKESNQVWFESQEEAEKAGYSPSKCSRDMLGI